ncbi:hypothetical protein GOP47_0008995 [Adiantum capillus-veneris]|uniref:Pentatricopeptide repeat-containing protein n=1 Tax=Adiantum capillus-veneris TaxID=13818 RepID=A0A9D4ZL88_ADICA|nr:hypothetical protein GOP47_0008995 [Adiantum capillus-veneris]
MGVQSKGPVSSSICVTKVSMRRQATGRELWTPCGVVTEEEGGRIMSGSSRLESLWKVFFRDPSQWWDCRALKFRPTWPDFIHKHRGQSLWLDGWHNPSWVLAELKRHGLSDGQQPLHTQIEFFKNYLKACTRDRDLLKGTRIHDELVKRRLIEPFSDFLAAMYASCNQLGKAKALIDLHKIKNNIPWTALIAGYLRKGQSEQVLDCLEQMEHEGILRNSIIYCCALKVCAMTRAADKGTKSPQ